MKRVLATFFSVLGMVALLGGQAQAAEGNMSYGKQKVVYHVNYPGGKDNKAWKGAMRNIQNHINAVGAENMDIKVVIHSNGIYLLKDAKTDDSLSQPLEQLRAQNVQFQVCANTIAGKKDINSVDDLYRVFDEDVVPSGVAQLSHLQQQGYTYIKP